MKNEISKREMEPVGRDACFFFLKNNLNLYGAPRALGRVSYLDTYNKKFYLFKEKITKVLTDTIQKYSDTDPNFLVCPD